MTLPSWNNLEARPVRADRPIPEVEGHLQPLVHELATIAEGSTRTDPLATPLEGRFSTADRSFSS